MKSMLEWIIEQSEPCSSSTWRSRALEARITQHLLNQTIVQLPARASQSCGQPPAQMEKVRKFYSSPNGDRWYLIRGPSGAVFIRSEANVASGGHIEHMEIGVVLSSGQRPEQQELLRLMATLVDEHPVHA